MSHVALRCTECGRSIASSMATISCRQCASPLEVVYTGQVEPLGLPGMWGLGAPVPLHSAKHAVHLGEGQTPCVRLVRLGKQLGLADLSGKLEFLNPTGSFKDRGTAVLISIAREQGIEEVVEDSSGNAGASIAAYCARAGIRAHIFAPASAPPAKVQQIRVYGAQLHLIEGSREDTAQAARSFVEERRLCYASHNWSPFFIEGTKTFAYEVVQQMRENLPIHILFPVGNGSLLLGTWKGFLELKERGAIQEMPRLHCIQAEAFKPIVAAFKGEPWAPASGAWAVAGGISVERPPRKGQVVRALRSTGGKAVAVGDGQILLWQRALAEEEGIYAEPTSATAFAGLDRLMALGEIAADDVVLIPITGSGLKDVAPV